MQGDSPHVDPDRCRQHPEARHDGGPQLYLGAGCATPTGTPSLLGGSATMNSCGSDGASLQKTVHDASEVTCHDRGSRSDHDVDRRIRGRAGRRPGQGARRGRRATALLGVRRARGPTTPNRAARRQARTPPGWRRSSPGSAPSSPAGGRTRPPGIGVTRTHGACRCSSSPTGRRRSRRAGPSRSSPGWRRRSRGPSKPRATRTSTSWAEPMSSARRSNSGSSRS